MKTNGSIIRDLNPKQKEFCRQYIFDWNATRAYKTAYKVKDTVAGQQGHQLLKNPKIHEYCKYLQDNLEQTCNISRSKVLAELQKMAFNSISSLHNTWIERKDFESLTADQKACISEISTKILKKNIGTQDEPDIVDVEFINIKLFDKNKAIESINKMLGYNAPEKREVTADLKTKISNIFPTNEEIERILSDRKTN